MKKKKFLASVMLSLMVAVSTVATAFAAPSPEATPTKPIIATDQDGNDILDDVTIGTVKEDELPELPADITSGKDTAINAIKVDIPDGVEATLTVDVPGVKEGDSIYALVYDDATKSYKKAGAVAGLNVVSFDVDHDAIVVFAKGYYYTFEVAPKTWTIGSNAEFMFKSEAEFEKFLAVKVDGQEVDKANYEVKKGSTEIYFKAAYLDTLSVGSHSLEGKWYDGSAAGSFEVVEAGSSQPAGDTAPITALSIMAILSALVACGFVVKTKLAK